MPAYRRQLDRTLGWIGRKRTDVRALVLTHGHIDHTGLASALAADGAAVHLHTEDEALAANPRSNKTERSPLRYLAYPATLGFVGHCVRQGALNPPTFPAVKPLIDGASLDAPGHPVVVHTPGHTAGHCALHFQDHGVAIVGDALCTADPFSGRRAAPQVQTRGSNRSSSEALASLDRLAAIDARTVLPGHGNPWRDGIEAAIASARAIGCR